MLTALIGAAFIAALLTLPVLALIRLDERRDRCAHEEAINQAIALTWPSLGDETEQWLRDGAR